MIKPPKSKFTLAKRLQKEGVIFLGINVMSLIAKGHLAPTVFVLLLSVTQLEMWQPFFYLV